MFHSLNNKIHWGVYTLASVAKLNKLRRFIRTLDLKLISCKALSHRVIIDSPVSLMWTITTSELVAFALIAKFIFTVADKKAEKIDFNYI